MARTNKYTSLNFNDIYEKKKITSNPNSPATTKSPSSSSSSSLSSSHKSYSLSAASRLNHGGMLLLSRPSPKPPSSSLSLPSPPLSPSPSPSLSSHKSTQQPMISLRPQGSTGSTPVPSSFPSLEREITDLPPSTPSPKTDKFVPPHLRPGFVAREQAPVPPTGPRPGNFRPGSAHGHYGSPNRCGEDGRPKSGGGYDRRMRGVAGGVGGEMDPAEFNRLRSGGAGTRPSSSG